MSDFDQARERGIIAEGARGFMAFTKGPNGTIRVDASATARMLAQDAAITTTNNVGFPSAYYTYLNPQVVPILFAATNATRMFPEAKIGAWTDDYTNFPVEEVAGDVTPYSDYAGNGATDVNFEFPVREQFRFQTTIRYGDLEADKAAAAKISLVAQKQQAAAQVIARAENRFYLYGVAGKQVYGILNDANLSASISPVSVNSKSTWADKLADDADGFANVCYADINKLWNDLASKNGANVDQNAHIVLAFSNAVASYLNVPNAFGLTATQMLKQNFPNMEMVQVPELSTGSGEMLYMIVPELLGTETGNCAFSDKFRMGRLVAHSSHFEQKVAGTTWGAIIKRPVLISRMLGV